MRWQKNRTAFWLVKRIQSNSARRRSAASRACESSTAAKLTVGNNKTSAPNASSECASSCACSVARVTTTRFPSSSFLTASNGTPRQAQNPVRTRFYQDLAEPHAELFGLFRASAQFLAHKFLSVGGKNASLQSQLAILSSRPGTKWNLAASFQF